MVVLFEMCRAPGKRIAEAAVVEWDTMKMSAVVIAG